MTSRAVATSSRALEPLPAPRPSWADDQTLAAVRPEVRAILEGSPAFSRLTPDEQRALASTMVKVCAYMTNPDGLAAQELSSKGGLLAPGGAVARAQEDETPSGEVAEFADRLKTAGERFTPAGVKAGVQQFGELVKKVDFTKFVSGLIQGVFKAIVDSSIQQMRAYGELLANVAKTVDQFAQDNITENNARDYLAGRFPDTFEIATEEMSGGFEEGAPAAGTTTKIAVKEGAPDNALEVVNKALELKEKITDISDPEAELKIVTAARLQIARSRQQLLASMVMLGINRIVVTDGLIHAKVVFDMRASDRVKRQAKASSSDRESDRESVQAELGYSSWFSPWSGSMKSSAEHEHETTVESSVDDTSESKADVKAKLTGEVRVNFKSDYFPMDKMASPQMIAAIQGNAIPPDKPVTT
jgi:hypothetical protein